MTIDRQKLDAIHAATVSLRDAVHTTELQARLIATDLKLLGVSPGGPHDDGPMGSAFNRISEAIGQAMLAVRHIEDARMRLGKVLQYAVQGGVEYGKPTE